MCLLLIPTVAGASADAASTLSLELSITDDEIILKISSTEVVVLCGGECSVCRSNSSIKTDGSVEVAVVVVMVAVVVVVVVVVAAEVK